jgi:hypothetical protein
MEVGFVSGVGPGAEDGGEVTAGGHAESVDEIARPPLVLLLHKNAGPSASTRRRCWPARATYV